MPYNMMSIVGFGATATVGSRNSQKRHCETCCIKCDACPGMNFVGLPFCPGLRRRPVCKGKDNNVRKKQTKITYTDTAAVAFAE